MVSRSQINYLMSKASNQFMIRTLIETNKNLTDSNQKMVQEIRELSDKCWQQRLDLVDLINNFSKLISYIQMEIQGDYLRLRGQLNAYGALVFFDNKCRNEVVGLLKENKYGLTKTVMEMIKTEDDKTRGKRFKIYYEKNVLGFKTEIETKDGSMCHL
jgi:hypothetical protein